MYVSSRRAVDRLIKRRKTAVRLITTFYFLRAVLILVEPLPFINNFDIRCLSKEGK